MNNSYSRITYKTFKHNNFNGCVILALIRSAGGDVQRKLYLPLFRIYDDKLRETRYTVVDPAIGSKTSVPVYNEYDEDYDPKHPASIEVKFN